MVPYFDFIYVQLESEFVAHSFCFEHLVRKGMYRFSITFSECSRDLLPDKKEDTTWLNVQDINSTVNVQYVLKKRWRGKF